MLVKLVQIIPIVTFHVVKGEENVQKCDKLEIHSKNSKFCHIFPTKPQFFGNPTQLDRLNLHIICPKGSQNLQFIQNIFKHLVGSVYATLKKLSLRLNFSTPSMGVSSPFT